jgi:hypothetical protein
MIDPIYHAIERQRGCTLSANPSYRTPTPMPSQQLSITLDEDLVAFIDQQGSNRSAAIAEAVRCWRDQQWLEEVNQAYDQEALP